MIGTHHDLPRIVHHQIPLEANRPLQRVNEVFVFKVNRRNSTARLQFRVRAIPFRTVDLLEKISQRTVARHARGGTKHHLANVDSYVGMSVYKIRQRRDLGTQRLFLNATAAVAVKLDVGQMTLLLTECFHRF